jgi:hypothetical protein
MESPKNKLATPDNLAQYDDRELLKEVAMDIGKQVAHHIETMYPEAVKAASSTFLLSVRNCTYNEIMNLKADKFGLTPQEWLNGRRKHRRTIKRVMKSEQSR